MGAKYNLFRWIGLRAVTAGLLLGLVVTVGALWLGVRDRADFQATHNDLLRSLNGERGKIEAALGEVHARLGRITAEIATGEDRVRQTDAVIGELRGLDSNWDKLTGDAQQKANTGRREKLEQQRAAAMAGVAALREDYTRTGWERDGLEIALGKVEARVTEVQSETKAGHYLGEAWNYQVGGLKVRGWVILLFGLYVGMMVVWRKAVGAK